MIDFIVADSNKEEIGYLPDSVGMDIEVGGENTYLLTIPLGAYESYKYQTGGYFYKIGTEYGGRLDDLKVSTEDGIITFQGDTFRGMLKGKIIEPPENKECMTYSGDLNRCISTLLGSSFGDLFVAQSGSSGKTGTYEFPRYCTLLDGLEGFFSENGYKLVIRSEYTSRGFRVRLSAEPVEDNSDEVEMSQDGKMFFEICKKTNLYTHMIVLGEGEGKEQTVLKFRFNKNGKPIQIDTIPDGENVKVLLYEEGATNGVWDDTDEGKADRRAFMNDIQLQFEEANGSDYQQLSVMDELEMEVGDIIGGRDYVTGTYIKQAITKKIYTYSDKQVDIQYTIGEIVYA